MLKRRRHTTVTIDVALIKSSANWADHLNDSLTQYRRRQSLYSHKNHHVAPLARISLTLSRYPSLSSIASAGSSELPPVSTQSCCMYDLTDHPAFDRPCEGVHRSRSLMSSSLLLQQCPACLVRLILIVFVMGGRTAAALLGNAPRTCSILLAAYPFS